MSEASDQTSTGRRRNWWVWSAWFLAAIGLFGIAFLIVLEAILDAAPYLGALYFLFALMIALSLLLFLAGFIHHRRIPDPERQDLATTFRFTLDFAKRQHLYAIASITLSGWTWNLGRHRMLTGSVPA